MRREALAFTTSPTLTTRHNLHHSSPTTRRSALSSALSHRIIHHSRLHLTSTAQRARSMGGDARWGPDSGYHQIEVTHESHYAAIRNPDQSQAIALADRRDPLTPTLCVRH